MTSVSRGASAKSRAASRSSLPARIRWRPRWSVTHLVMVAAGLIAFVATLVVLRDREIVIEIPVVTADIAAGEVVDADRVSLVTTRGPSVELTTAAVTADELVLATEQGLVAARDIPASAVLSSVDLTEPGEISTTRTMSIPAAATDGVVVSLDRGDVVDVVAVVDDVAVFVATGVSVVDVTSGVQTAAGPTAVTVAVDAEDSLRLAWTLDRSELRFVRVGGAAPANPAAGYPERGTFTDDG